MSDSKQEQTAQQPDAPSDETDRHADEPMPAGPVDTTSQDKPAPPVPEPAVEPDRASAGARPERAADDADESARAAPDGARIDPTKAGAGDAPPANDEAGDAAGTDGTPTSGTAPAGTPQQRRRRIRRTARTEVVEGAEAPATDEEPPPEGRRRRRRRRRARSSVQGEASEPQDQAARADSAVTEESSEESSPASGEVGEPERRRRRTRRRTTRRQTEGGGPSSRPAAAGKPAEARAGRPPGDRQDRAGGSAPRPDRPTRPKPAEPVADKRGKAPGKGQDMVTLILHPQPKAAPTRRKKAGRPLTAKEALKAKAAKRGAGSGRTKDRADGATGPAVELREEWLTADAEQAVGWVLEAGGAASQLIRAWQQQPNPVAIAAIAYDGGRTEGAPIPTAIRKAARRALQVLKSRGVAVPERPAQDAPAAGPALAGDREPEPFVATFVPPDTNGMTFFSISQRLAGGRYRVADVVIREGLGVMHASSGRLAGKQIRRWRSRVESRLGTAPVDVPLQWARHRIAVARDQNATSGQVLPLGLDSCAPLFEPCPESEPAHPMADLEEDFGEAELTTAAAQSDELHNDPEFRSWLPEKGALDEMLRNVGTRVGAEGAQDRELVDKVMQEEIEAATDRYFSPEVRGQLEQRMRDAAVSVRERADDAAARRVLCVARAVREAGLITSPPRELPFLVGFFRKAIAVMAQQGQGRLQVPVVGAPPGVDEAEPSDDGTNQQVDG